MKAETYDLKYDPGPVTMDYLADKDSRVNLLIGPFGTGKTSAAAFKKIMLQSKWIKPGKGGVRRSRFAVVRNTYPQLRDTTIRSYLDWFPPHAFGGKYLAADKQYTLRIGDREIEILFRALDDDNDVRNLLSLELSGAHIDEAREVKHSIFKGILGRVGRFPSIKDYDGENPFLSVPQVDLTTNYPNRDHWIYGDFVAKPISGYRMYEQRQEENKHNLPPNYYENLEMDYADRPDLLKTLVRGEWGITYMGKLVYPEFNRLLHVASRPLVLDPSLPIIRGWDNTGLHPGCVITQLSNTAIWMVKKEFWEPDIGITDFGEMVKIWCNDNYHGAEFRDIGDPAGKNRDSNKMSPKDYLRKIDIRIEDGIQTFKIRREAVAGRLTKLLNGKPAFQVDPNCVGIIDGFEGGYCYKEIGNSGIYKSEPEKNKYADLHDSLQYPATRLFVSGMRGGKKNNLNEELGKIFCR